MLGRDEEARDAVAGLRGRDDFPRDVADALACVAGGNGAAYAAAVEDVLHSFETRDAFLEDVAVADTALVLERVAAARGLASGLRESLLLPPV